MMHDLTPKEQSDIISASLGNPDVFKEADWVQIDPIHYEGELTILDYVSLTLLGLVFLLAIVATIVAMVATI